MKMPKLHRRFSVQILAYMLLVNIVAIGLVSLLLYWQTSNNAIAELRAGFEQMLDNGQSDIDQALLSAENVFIDLQRDKELYELFENYDDTKVSPLSAQRDVLRIINSYVLHKTEILSVQIMTSKGIFYNANTSYTSIYNMEKSRLYGVAQACKQQAVWIPTYDFTKEYGHERLETVSVPNRYVFSLVGMFNAYNLSTGYLRYWPDSVERPVLVISLSEEFLRDVLQRHIYRPGATMFVLDEDGTIISTLDESKLLTKLDDEYLAALDGTGKTAHCFSRTVGGVQLMIGCAELSNGWRIVTAISEDSVRGEILKNIGSTVAVIAAVTLFVSLLLSWVISNRISRPITRLRKAIEKSGSGDFSLRIDGSSDEFNSVYEAFNNMNQQIHQLIEDNYASRIREKEHQLQALKYQTSPHFLYNALTLIHMSAMKTGATETARLAMHLSKMLNYTVRDRRDTVTLVEELDNVRDFMAMVDVGYEGTIKLEVSVPDNLLDVRLPKLCLQPLCENAVLHGLHGCQEGLILIEGHFENGNMLISICDNGVGLPDGFEMREPDDMSSFSIGLMNVHQRLRLLYGDEAGLFPERNPDGGTCIRVQIPLFRSKAGAFPDT